MTNPTKNPAKSPVRMVMATKTLQQVVFTLGGKDFFSRRLTGEEELVYEHAQMQSPFAKDAVERYRTSVQVLTGLLRKRLAKPEDSIDEDWVAGVTNPGTEMKLLAYLRTGHNGPGLVLPPDESFDLPSLALEWDDGHLFEGPALSYTELFGLHQGVSFDAVESMNKLGSFDPDNVDIDQLRATSLGVLDQLTGLRRHQVDSLADILNARLKEGEQVSGQWLLDTFNNKELTALENFLRSGELPAEGDNPNAESTPANVPINS